MFNFLQRIKIDWSSFWVGFLIASLFWWLLRLLRPTLQSALQKFKEQFAISRQGVITDNESRYRNNLYKFLQSYHIASPLFSLNEIIVKPRLLAPPPTPEPGTPPPEDITRETIPYTPDYLEFDSAYNSPTITLGELVNHGYNVILAGRAGIGKTIALIDFANQVIKQDPDLGEAAHLFPIFIHINDLNLLSLEDQSPIEILSNAILEQTWAKSISRLDNLITQKITNQNAILLIDGLDEVPHNILDDFQQFIGIFHAQFPNIPIITTVSSDYFGELPALGFIDIYVLPWNEAQKLEFLTKWGNLWNLYIEDNADPEYHPPDPYLLNSWIFTRSIGLTPLELTLKAWAAYANDLIGLRGADFIESYIRRVCSELAGSRSFLESIALSAALTFRISFDQDQFGSEQLVEENENDTNTLRPSTIFQKLIERKVFYRRAQNQFIFNHPVIFGYLVASAIEHTGIEQILNQPSWIIKHLTIHYLNAKGASTLAQHATITRENRVLYEPMLHRAYALKDQHPEQPEARQVIQEVLKTIQNETVPFLVRARLINIIAILDFDGINHLLKRLLNSPEARIRQVSALAAGYRRELNLIPDLIALIQDQPAIQRATCLALVNIGTSTALEAVARALLEGSEELRRAAAEALANHPEEGHPTLKEGTQVEDILVRRAVIFGLRRIRQPWVRELLEQVAIEEGQWVVRNAAEQALEEWNNPTVRLPKAQQELHNIPWLVAFAAEREMGVAPGEPAREMLFRALKEGNIDEKIAALDVLARRGDDGIFPEVYNLLYGSDSELADAAFHAIWYVHRMGRKIPSPMQFGY